MGQAASTNDKKPVETTAIAAQTDVVKDYTYDAVVLGAGIHGLSIARELTSRNLRVAILARDLPTDLESTAFASPWAGADWHSFARSDEPREQEWDRRTFVEMMKLVGTEEGRELVEVVRAYDVWEEGFADVEEKLNPWFKALTPNFRRMTRDQLPEGCVDGVEWDTIVFNPPALLARLHARLTSAGVPFVRARVTSLDQAYEHPAIGKVNLVVNASALGARGLVGVEDEKVHPVRGQIVLVYAPWVKEDWARGRKQPVPGRDDGISIYIIPRAGSAGHVILGGTRDKNKYSTLPSLATAKRILRDCYDICPALAGPNGKSWQDIEVISHNVGLRPARDGGCRLELEERETVKNRVAAPKISEARKVGCVHAYGIGGAGYQSSIGFAHEAADLVQQYLRDIGAEKA